MKITLIFPCYKYPTAGGTEEPLGILYIASALRNLGEDVSYIDLSDEKDLKILDSAKASDIIGISSTSPLFGRTKLVLDQLKKINRKATYIIGGPHATIDPSDALNAGFDMAVIGEGEQTVAELISGLRSGQAYATKGIAYKKNGDLQLNPKTPFIEDLDTISFPWRDELDYSKYRALGILGTRGCPYNCAYCKPTADKLFGKKVRKRSVENIVDELEQCFHVIENLKVTFKDDTFTFYSTEWFDHLHREIQKRKLKLKWKCNSAVRSLSYDKLRSMKKSGCVQLCFGVESGSPKILEFYRKKQTPDEVAQAFKWCHELKIRTYAYIMVGAPIETVDDLDLTYKLIKRIKPYNGLVSTVSAFPGTELYSYSLSKGHLKETIRYEDYDFSNNAEKGKTPLKLKYLSDEDLKRYISKISRYFVSRALISSFSSTDIWKDAIFSSGFRKRAIVILRKFFHTLSPLKSEES